MVHEGRLALDTPLPGKPYSLRHLLQHRSGVPDYGGLPAYHRAVEAGERAWSRTDLLAAVRPDQLLFAPDEGWAYSNVGSLFVREAVEAQWGDYASVIARNFPEAGFRLAQTLGDFEGLHKDVALRYDPAWVYHGCMIGTARAAAQVLSDLMGGTVLPKARLDDMLRGYPILDAAPGRPFRRIEAGLGLFIAQYDGLGRVVGHPGAGPGSTCGVWHFPDHPRAPTIAAFSDADTEAVPEWEVVRVAQSLL